MRQSDHEERLPTMRRQVNEDWLREYRGWVYGVAFGGQLGVGVSTIVTTSLVYVTLLAAFLAGGAGSGAAIVGLFGAARGATLLAGARVRRPERAGGRQLRGLGHGQLQLDAVDVLDQRNQPL